MKTKKKKRSSGRKKGSRTWAYPVEFRLRIVRLYLEEGYSASLICEEFGISTHSVRRWVKAYRQGGRTGIRTQASPRRQTQGNP